MFKLTKFKKRMFSGILILMMMTTFFSTAVLAAPIDLSKEKTIYSVANAHLDTQWNWDVRTTINSYLPKTFNNNFALFEKYPDYKFNFEGAFRYDLIKEYYPKEYEKIKDYIEQGRWNVAGSSWEAGDVNIPSPEALMRNILLGNGFFKEEFGKTSKDIFLPDCFGFGYALPSIASHMGLEGFSTQKLTWGSAYGIPFNIGKWYGVDGSSILAALNPGSYTTTYRNSLIAQGSTWVDRVNDNGSKSGVNAAFSYHGTGDTGGSPSETSVSTLQKDIDKGIDPETGVQVISATSDQLFRDITPEQAENLPSFDNELVMSTHAVGGYTSKAISKRWNRQNELLADATERTSVVADWLGGAPYPKEKLDTAWKRFIWHQMHDDLPGTSLPSAYNMTWNDYIISLNQFAEELTNGVGAVARGLDTQTEGIPVVVNNSTSKARQDVVEAKIKFNEEAPKAVQVFDSKGSEVPSQLISVDGKDATIAFLADMPSVGYEVYDVRASESESQIDTGLKITESTLENNYFKVAINKDGDIGSVYDKVSKKELLSAPARLELFDNNSTTWPSWEILRRDISDPREYVSGPAEIEIVENGPVSVALKVTRKTAGSTFSQIIRLSAGKDDQRVDVDNNVDWQSKATLLKAAFPLTVANDTATYDLGLGTIERGNNTDKLYEVPGQQWADITDSSGDYGVSILNDSKYGWDKPNDNTLRLTLIHTPKGSYGGNNQDVQDMGENRFLYSIYGHKGDWVEGNTVAQGERINQPLRAFQTVKHNGDLGKSTSFLTIDNPHITVKALKQAENSDEIIVRVQETSGSPSSNVTLSMGKGIASAREVNGFEDEIGEAVVENGKLKFHINRYEPKTFAVTLNAATIKLDAPSSVAMELPFNKDVISSDANRKDGALDADGRTIPAEILPSTITSKGIDFKMGPKADGSNNAVASKGQEISIPDGYKQVYFLATSTAGDVVETFKIDETPINIGIQDYRENVGGWDQRGAGTYLGIKRDPVAWTATHTHTPTGNSPYDYEYLYKYKIDLPEGASTITLPDNENILVFAMTASNNSNDDTIAAAALYDEKESAKTFKVTVKNGIGGGNYPEGTEVAISADVPVGYAFKEWIGNVEDPKSINTTVKVPGEDIQVEAVFTELGTNLALNKTVTASGYVNDREKPEFGVDGERDTKWCATGSRDKWLMVDLGKEQDINSWVVRHAGDGGESSGWNTRDFKLQASNDGEKWTDVDSVVGNTDNITYRPVEPFSARYVRLYITRPTNTSDSAARIYEFEIYNEENPPERFKLTVEKGTGSGTYLEGAEVPVSADIPVGYTFKEWIGPVEDPKSINTKIIMPKEDVHLEAVLNEMGTNLALDKTVTASGYTNDREKPGFAIDGERKTKWCATGSEDKWLMVDLEQEHTIDRWLVRHAGDGGENSDWNTSDFKLQASDDGKEWVDVDAVKDNKDDITDRQIDAITTRYVRLYITDPEHSPYTGAARIYEFEVYGPELKKVGLGLEDTTLERNQTSKATISEAVLFDGKTIDLEDEGATIEYLSSDADVVSIEKNIVTGKNVGTAEIYAKVTFNGLTIESNKIPVTVKTSCASIERLIEGFTESEDLTGPLVPQLINSLKQAKQFKEEGKIEQAIKHIEDNFVKHLNNPPMDLHVSKSAKEILNLDAQALFEQWTEE